MHFCYIENRKFKIYWNQNAFRSVVIEKIRWWEYSVIEMLFIRRFYCISIQIKTNYFITYIFVNDLLSNWVSQMWISLSVDNLSYFQAIYFSNFPLKVVFVRIKYLDTIH